MQLKPLILSTVLLATAVLQGCKHPLAIVGEGDIVEVGNSGRGCTLEQFRAGDIACTQNEVSGDYFVDYKAVPRPGWRFVKWEGPCPLDSEFQHCQFAVAKEAVTWWDETYPGNTIPPSTAVFQRIEGETGYLLAGTPVAGVTYETDTQQGVTGLDGNFQYLAGEIVRFRIGSTALGEVPGQERVTPFDLARSPVLHGLDFAPAIRDENHPFQGVINIAVLLQSLDHDVNPENGIVIRQGVADLLHSVRLDLRDRWSTFQKFGGMSIAELDYRESNQNETTLRHALATASRQHRFSVPHRVVRPSTALARLYKTLEIDPRLTGVSLLQLADGHGVVLRTERFQYETRGYLTLHDDTTPEAFESWQYDFRGNLTRYERKIEKYGFDDRVETWQYDSMYNEVRHERDYGADGSAEDVYTTQYQYNPTGNMLRVSQPAETPQSISIREYDPWGHLIYREEDENGDTRPDLILNWRYDTRGYLVHSETDYDTYGLADSVSDWQYDASGHLVRAAKTSHLYIGTGSVLTEYEISTWQYDANGNVTQISREWDNSAEGAGFITGTWGYEYDSDGRMTGRQLVYSDDRVDEVETWQYDAAGRLTRNTYLGGSGSPEHVKSWRYDPAGNVIEFTEEWWNQDDKSVPNKIETWRYDSNGNAISRTRDDADSELGTTITWEHDSNGYPTLATEVRYFNGVIGETVTYHYAPTGWGYLFADAWVFPYPEDWPPEAAPFR